MMGLWNSVESSLLPKMDQENGTAQLGRLSNHGGMRSTSFLQVVELVTNPNSHIQKLGFMFVG